MTPRKRILLFTAIGVALGLGVWAGRRSVAPAPARLPAVSLVAPATAAPEPLPPVKATSSAHEVWVALRPDAQAGTGTITDPFDASSVERLNALFMKFRKEYGDNITIHFGPGVFYGDRLWVPGNNWHILGAGRDITVFKTAPNPERIETVGFRPVDVMGFVLSDVTFDFNVLNLRKANRVFTHPWGKQRRVSYFFSEELPAWETGKAWKCKQGAMHEGREYMCVKDTREEPGTGPDWSALRPNRPESLPAWKPGTLYAAGDAVALGGAGYICLDSKATTNPVAGGSEWEKVNPEAIDPNIYTVAVFGGTAWPRSGERAGGRSRVSRVRAVNCNGSAFFNHEDFVIGLGGSDCVIEDCIVEQFHGDYASLIVLMSGRNSVVRGCTVKGNGKCFAYGGWACFDAVYENNYCENVDAAVNIDSLNNRNVTFRNNTFVNCRGCGIVVNVGGVKHHSFPDYWGELDGRKIDLNEHAMDGLFIYNNYIERADDARLGAIQVQQELLTNVQIHDNIIRTASGSARGCAIGVLQADNVSIYGNRCDPNLYCEIIGITGGFLCYDNYDLEGRQMKYASGHPIDHRPEP
jgi:hypothetical protein